MLKYLSCPSICIPLRHMAALLALLALFTAHSHSPLAVIDSEPLTSVTLTDADYKIGDGDFSKHCLSQQQPWISRQRSLGGDTLHCALPPRSPLEFQLIRAPPVATAS